MSFLENNLERWKGAKWPIVIAGILVCYFAFISGLSTNPGGFYYDEACEAYNGYLIATTGTAENGTSFPLFFQCYTGGLTQWMSPLFIYMMAGMYSIVPPSSLSAHVFSATLVFIAILFLGMLAARISGKWLIGVIVAVTAMATPWLFEISRLVQETSALSLGIVLFLFCLYNAYRHGNWRLSDYVLLAASLAMITYAYAAGRVLGPGFAFGLLIFAINNKRALFDVFKTWAVYFVLLIPFIIVYFTNGDAITGRFKEVSYITPKSSLWDIIQEFVPAFFGDLSPAFLLVNGDHLYRHHIPVMGGVFVATFVLAIVGLVMVILRHRGDAWWRFILYALIVSVLPGALTVHRQHFLRLLALPILMLILMVPALLSLIYGRDAASTDFGSAEEAAPGDLEADTSSTPARRRSPLTGKRARYALLVVLLLVTVAQAVYFQKKFWFWQPERRSYFSSAYPQLFERALQETLRPIYLQDGRYGPAYILALWYATVQGVDLSNFVHLPEDAAPPPDSLVLGSVTECVNCYEILGKEAFLLYQTKGSTARPGIQRPGSATVGNKAMVPTIFGSEGTDQGKFSKPRGATSDQNGNFYIADSGNNRIQKFDSERKFVASFSRDIAAEGHPMDPEGVAVDTAGNLYATDVANHILIKFGPDGRFVKHWQGPDTGFYGPRDIAINQNNQLFIVDSGLSRIVRFDTVSENVIRWGGPGSGERQFNAISGVTVADDLVIVVDAGNKRVQAFDFDGNFVRQWTIDAWTENVPEWPDAVFDKQKKLLYISDGLKQELLAFDLDGNQVDGVSIDSKQQQARITAMSILEAQKKRYLIAVDPDASRLLIFEIGEVKDKK